MTEQAMTEVRTSERIKVDFKQLLQRLSDNLWHTISEELRSSFDNTV